MTYFFDTSVLIEMIKGTPAFAELSEEEITTSILNLAELHYLLLRDFNKRTADYWRRKLEDAAFPVDSNLCFAAMELRLKHRARKLSFIDCLSYCTSQEHGRVFLTKDTGFRGFKNVRMMV